MAATAGQGKYSITVEPRALKDLFATLNALDKEHQNKVRDRAQPISKEFARRLAIGAAFGTTPPQAILVARSISTPRDRIPRVDIGGSKKVGRPYGGKRKGSKRTSAPAGALLWGSEFGSRPGTDSLGRPTNKRFVKGRNRSGYWIAPTTDNEIKEVAAEYEKMLSQVIAEQKLNGASS
jgi:hypothetical protein